MHFLLCVDSLTVMISSFNHCLTWGCVCLLDSLKICLSLRRQRFNGMYKIIEEEKKNIFDFSLFVSLKKFIFLFLVRRATKFNRQKFFSVYETSFSSTLKILHRNFCLSPLLCFTIGGEGY